MKMKKFFKSVVMVCACVLASGMLKAPTYVQAANPYLPLWEHVPDGEPYVFEDPDNPGKERVYIYGSHDTIKTNYCGYDLVVWSAPVEDLNNWRYDGVIFESIVNGKADVLFAPDIAVREENGEKVYYLYPNNQGSGRKSMIAKSKSPVGPFEVCNWTDETHTQTTGCMGFDPAAFVDDDGRVYGYWGFQETFMAELDPDTMSSVKEGTEVRKNIIDSCKDEGDGDFRFFEASSIRKIKDKYVFIYSRNTKNGEDGLSANNATLAYAYSDGPLGPWTYGGTIIDARAPEKNGQNKAIGVMPGHNTHGSILEINGQWYVFYHRATNNDGYARQATVEPVEVKVTEGKVGSGGKVEISKAEVTSQGFETDGLNPYEKHSSGIACFLYNEKNGDKGYVKATYNERVNGSPVVRNKDGGIVGFKYFNFDGKPGEGQTTKLSIDMLPKGNDGTIEIWLDRPWESQQGKKIGTIEISKDDPLRQIRKQVELPELDKIDGKHAIFFKFSSSSGKEICDLYDFVFENTETLAESTSNNSWTIESGSPVISAGSLTLKGGDSLFMKDGMKWDNYLVSQNISLNGGALSVKVRKTDAHNYYEAGIQEGTVTLYSLVNGKRTILAQCDTDLPFTSDTKLSVKCVDSSISVRINDGLVLKVNDNTHKKGTAAYAFTGNGSASVGKIRVEASGQADEILMTETGGVKINGKVYESFSTEQREYVVPYPKGSEVPTVEAFTNDPGTRITVAQAKEFPGAAVVKFEGTSERTYTFKFIEEVGETQEIAWGNNLPDGWEIINDQNSSAQIKYENNSVTICGVSGPDFPNTKNILQMKEKLTDNWEATVKCNLTGEFGDTLYAQYGIGLKGTGTIKVDVEQQWKGGYRAKFGNDGVSAGDGKSGYLRVRRLGDRIEGLFSKNGTEYEAIGSVNAAGYEEPQIQLFVAPQSRAEQFDVTFSEMKISHLPDEVSADQQLEDITTAERIAAIAEAGIIIQKGSYADDTARAQAAIEVLKASGVTGAENADYEIKYNHGCPYLVITAGSASIMVRPLEIRESAGKQALVDVIGKIEKLDSSIYTEESWQRLESLLDTARQAAANGSQTEIARMEEYLNAGMNLLEEKPLEGVVNKNALRAAIERPKNLKKTDYTATSWKAMQEALKTANEALESATVTQQEVNAATDGLRKALEALVWVDKSGLRAAIDRADERNEADYTASSWTAMQAALTNAKTVAGNADAVQTEIDAATRELSEALRNLEEKKAVNKNALSAAIDRTKNLKETNYTASSWTAMQAALTTANETLESGAASQEEVDAATAGLRKALEALVWVDKSGLNSAIDRAGERKEEDYTDKPDEWASMQAALVKAKEVAENPDSLQKKVDDAAYELSEALRALDQEGKVNKDALSAAIDRKKNLKETDYTASSWAVLQKALERASEAMESETVTQEEVNAATISLREAFAGLVWVDKSGLRAAIDRAGERKEADYTASSWAAMQAALTKANTVAGKGDAVQKEIDDATFELSEALRKLETKKEINKNALSAAIDRTKELKETDYTAATWTAMQQALKTANGAMESESVTQEEVNAAATALREALEALVRVDKSGLKAAIDRANERTEADYTKESWTAMQKALTKAKETEGNGDAVQKVVDEATYELSEALRNLKYAEPEKEELSTALNAAKALKKENYTPAAWAAFQKVLADAEAIFNNPKATKEQRAAAAAALKKAVEEVKKNPAGNITPPTAVKVNKISISGLSKKIAAGKKIQLTAKISPSNASIKDVTWESSNKKVATVNSKGIVTLKKNSGGKSVTITATAKDGSKVKAAFKIKSMKGRVTKVTISGKKTVKAGKSLKLTGKVKAAKNANKKLKWTSSNKKYATVTSSGKVKTFKAGKGKKVRITAMATDGSGKKKTVTIKITK